MACRTHPQTCPFLCLCFNLPTPLSLFQLLDAHSSSVRQRVCMAKGAKSIRASGNLLLASKAWEESEGC